MNKIYTSIGQVLPFEEWLKQEYPENTTSKKFLHIIGALDIGYIMYRFQSKNKITNKPGQTALKERAVISPKIIQNDLLPKEEPSPAAELILDFTPTAETPVVIPPVIAQTTTVKTPEPLVVQEVIVEEATPAKVQPTGPVWFSDESLEDEDLRKTTIQLGIDRITVAFDVRDTQDERETLLMVNAVPYRVMLSKPLLNLSKTLQIARTSYGELYILGRMALGALSGEGYITAEEAARIVHTLAQEQKTTEVDVMYFTKNKTSRTRTEAHMNIRFERV